MKTLSDLINEMHSQIKEAVGYASDPYPDGVPAKKAGQNMLAGKPAIPYHTGSDKSLIKKQDKSRIAGDFQTDTKLGANISGVVNAYKNLEKIKGDDEKIKHVKTGKFEADIEKGKKAGDTFGLAKSFAQLRRMDRGDGQTDFKEKKPEPKKGVLRIENHSNEHE